MGKIDDMRRQREARIATEANAPVVVAEADDSAEAPRDADSGVCSVCKRTKPMQQGLLVSHQKGLGKMCTGSRKPPAA